VPLIASSSDKAEELTHAMSVGWIGMGDDTIDDGIYSLGRDESSLDEGGLVREMSNTS
jgi:hypothetical protein